MQPACKVQVISDLRSIFGSSQSESAIPGYNPKLSSAFFRGQLSLHKSVNLTTDQAALYQKCDSPNRCHHITLHVMSCLITPRIATFFLADDKLLAPALAGRRQRDGCRGLRRLGGRALHGALLPEQGTHHVRGVEDVGGGRQIVRGCVMVVSNAQNRES